MGIYNLKPEHEPLSISFLGHGLPVPISRNFGAYMFSQCVITDVHLFESRDKVFSGESVLQETIIVKVKKTTNKPECVNITTSSTSDFRDLKQFRAFL